MNKISILSLLFILINLYFLQGCSNENIVNNNPATNKGIFVLCKGIDSTIPGDYSYINLEKDTVSNNIFRLNNSGNLLGFEPNCIYRYLDHDLFISVAGLNSAGGKILHVDSRTNKAVDSVLLSSNPGNFVQENSRIYVCNPGLGSLTKTDIDLNILTASIPVGSLPKDVYYANDRIYVSKFSLTSENSLSAVNVFNDQAVKIFFPGPPVSVSLNFNTVFISSYTHKKIYRINPETPEIVSDSINIDINYDAIGDITPGETNDIIYIVALRVSSPGSEAGKAVYKLDLQTGNVTSFIMESPDLINITNIIYDIQYKTLFVTDSKNGLQNGEVRFYDKLGVLQKAYTVEGRNPMKLAIRY